MCERSGGGEKRYGQESEQSYEKMKNFTISEFILTCKWPPNSDGNRRVDATCNVRIEGEGNDDARLCCSDLGSSSFITTGSRITTNFRIRSPVVITASDCMHMPRYRHLLV